MSGLAILAPRALLRYHRPVLIDLGLLDQLSLRTGEGYALAIDWGELNADGVFEPTLRTSDDGKVLIDRAVLAELERRAGGSE